MMGQAKLRGTFEDRKAAAIERNERAARRPPDEVSLREMSHLVVAAAALGVPSYCFHNRRSRRGRRRV